jgi:tetratricopeptide (TPR) repeat protein
MGILIAFAVALASPFLIVQRGKRRVPYLSLSLAVVVLVATLSLPGSSRGFEQLFEYGGDPGRIAIWSDTVPAATRHLAAGSGLGTFAFAFQRSRVYFPRNTVDHAHSDWLEFLVEMGLPAALFAAIAIAGAFAFCLRRGRQGPLGLLRTALLMGAAVILVHSTVDFPLQIPALAALFSVLLGSAVGLADPAKRRVPAGPATRAIAALGCLSFGALAAAAAAGLPPSWNAESLFAAGHREFLAGRGAEAERRLRKALEANPYSALAWQKRAEIARMNGQPERAHQLVALAARLEPFTFRTEWPLAESLLQDRRWEPAAARLGNLAESIPDVRPAILRAALEAGMPMALIDEAVVPGGAGEIWLRALADREAWDQFERSLASRTAAGVTAAGVTVAGVAATGVTASPGELRYLFDRLFQFQQQRLMQHLWRAVRPKEFSESPSWRLAALTHHQTQGSGPSGNSANIPATRTTTLHRANNDFSDLPGPLDSGFGFQWVAHLVQNVQIRIPAARQPAARFELDFRAPTAAESVHLSHYFAVAPAAGYVLQADAKAKNLGGGEVTLEVWSARRLLASSTLARGSASRRIEVPFRAGASEEVLQLRVVSRRGGPLKAMHGTLLVGPFQLRSVHPASLVTEDR